jgi:hypothetical protein
MHEFEDTATRARASALLIFSFKRTAEVLLGKVAGNGFVGRQLADADVFVMQGPYAKGGEVGARVVELGRQVDIR